ncbi:MAG: transcription antitermination factor NusB [Paludibacteraceae bacterium]
MINRVLIRIKVIQILYSYYKSNCGSVENAEKELFFSLGKTYEMYFYLLMLINEITSYAAKRIEKEGNKYTATLKDKNQSRKFVNNQFAKQLSTNIQMKEYTEEHSLTWEQHESLIKELYSVILTSDAYVAYMKDEESSYQKDKDLWRALFKGVLSDNEMLGKELEEMSIYWNDDADVVVSFIVKTIKLFEEAEAENQDLIHMFRDDEDRIFARDLMRTSLYNEKEYRDMIESHTTNWDSERIAFMDIIIMQAALAEICNFPSIPVNVSMNEYIEITKLYSTAKSGNFINGILDAVVTDLRKDNKIIKAAYYTDNAK